MSSAVSNDAAEALAAACAGGHIDKVEATRASRISNPGGVKVGATARPSSSVARRLSENDSP